METIAPHLRVIIAIMCFTLIGIVVELIRQNRMRERFAIVWMGASVLVLVFGIWPDLLNVISRVVKLHHLTTLFTLCLIFLVAIILNFTVTISTLSERNRKLAQEVAIAKFQIEELKRSLDSIKCGSDI
ncbi:MAG: DUF2304 domain-containing protein [Deltaproteobacteria bacterium]|nr:DUF2304 domain-containing protein [Deltaproteobacteria bacterium]